MALRLVQRTTCSITKMIRKSDTVPRSYVPGVELPQSQVGVVCHQASVFVLSVPAVTSRKEDAGDQPRNGTASYSSGLTDRVLFLALFLSLLPAQESRQAHTAEIMTTTTTENNDENHQ